MNPQDNLTVVPKMKIWLKRGEQGFFGPGTLKLLKLTDKHRSIKVACAEMGLSYSKGWKIVDNLEESLGRKLINRRQGGSHGGSSSLTEFALALIDKYEEYCAALRKVSEGIFEETFAPEFWSL
ncbi:MAG: LysR family transcriptional regulator [Oscillospiraceae bacterium]|jgi:molybdate transport system regulatory protein|nr:LysR family transcriptional regulator [Oscillospiraceae bacterium]